MAARIRHLKLPGVQPCLALLRADRAEVQRLSALLSLHVSIFYRDPLTFAALRQFFFERTPARPQRWWSAGCAGGEEPYSLAILAAQTPELNGKVEIVASDVSPEILAKGRAGVFNSTHLSKIPAAEQARYFSAAGPGYRIGEEFRTRSCLSAACWCWAGPRRCAIAPGSLPRSMRKSGFISEFRQGRANLCVTRRQSEAGGYAGSLLP
jgi:chemotaxis protein methyltransferase CheR